MKTLIFVLILCGLNFLYGKNNALSISTLNNKAEYQSIKTDSIFKILNNRKDYYHKINITNYILPCDIKLPKDKCNIIAPFITGVIAMLIFFLGIYYNIYLKKKEENKRLKELKEQLSVTLENIIESADVQISFIEKFGDDLKNNPYGTVFMGARIQHDIDRLLSINPNDIRKIFSNSKLSISQYTQFYWYIDHLKETMYKIPDKIVQHINSDVKKYVEEARREALIFEQIIFEHITKEPSGALTIFFDKTLLDYNLSKSINSNLENILNKLALPIFEKIQTDKLLMNYYNDIFKKAHKLGSLIITVRDGNLEQANYAKITAQELKKSLESLKKINI